MLLLQQQLYIDINIYILPHNNNTYNRIIHLLAKLALFSTTDFPN